MLTVDIIGFTAATCTTVAFVPQAIKVFRSGDTESLSVLMYTTFTIGVALWLYYGLLREDAAIIVANIITFCLAFSILIIKIRNDFFPKTRPKP